MLRESARLNGLTDVALTKLDVLSGFDTIQICVAYEYKGKRMDYPPQEQGALDLVSPVYESWPAGRKTSPRARRGTSSPKPPAPMCSASNSFPACRSAWYPSAPTAIRLFSDKGMDRGRNLSEERLPPPVPLPKAFDQWGGCSTATSFSL